MAETVTIGGVGLTADLLLWRRYGRPGVTSAMLNAVYRLNPGLAAQGVVLPVGTVVTLPDLPPTPTVPARPAVSLFD